MKPSSVILIARHCRCEYNSKTLRFASAQSFVGTSAESMARRSNILLGLSPKAEAHCFWIRKKLTWWRFNMPHAATKEITVNCATNKLGAIFLVIGTRFED